MSDEADVWTNATFSDRNLDLTGREFMLCYFERCNLHADVPSYFLGAGNNQYHHCTFTGEGWPDWVKSSGAWKAAA